MTQTTAPKASRSPTSVDRGCDYPVSVNWRGLKLRLFCSRDSAQVRADRLGLGHGTEVKMHESDVGWWIHHAPSGVHYDDSGLVPSLARYPQLEQVAKVAKLPAAGR